jgi:hypothetical protein
MRKPRSSWWLMVAVLAAGCEPGPTEPGTPRIDEPRNLEGRYEWVLDGWLGTRPAGQPTVQLLWDVPSRWRNEPFRVYGRRAGDRDYLLVATVTACADGLCRYADANVLPGRRYEFYVAVVDEATGREVTSPSAIQVEVPAATRPSRPTAPQVTGLDEMLYLEWADAQGPAPIWKYRIFQERRGADSVFFEIGSTDGFGFLDVLVTNGVAYRYSIAAVDDLGHVSDRSPLSAAAIPRPEGQGALVYAHADFAAESGYRFDIAGQSGRPVPGDSPQAHWRLEATDQGWFLRPLGEVVVHPGVPTTALTCGPGSSPDCRSVVEAPAAGYQAAPVPLEPGYTYVLRLGSGAGANYAKLRVQVLATATQNRRAMVFDWAVQMVPGERKLDVVP